ncbi:MAG TPA: hypothetical protein VG982_03110 [Candidatus Paceibacterota bacterium]|jgi:hypothetical protein|nr:hypothetical protein [Candidatus Paceibacterota bacterium]
MRKSTLSQQLEKIVSTFSIDTISVEMTNETARTYEDTIQLLVVPRNSIPTKSLFDHIDLGRRDANTWFLEEKYFYDIVETPSTPYVLHAVDVSDWFMAPFRNSYDFSESGRPLTFHEVVTLAFQCTDLLNEKISGMQAYGSRFTKRDVRNPTIDDTLEIYRKGNPGNGFLKLAREFHRYDECTKIIPRTR